MSTLRRPVSRRLVLAALLALATLTLALAYALRDVTPPQVYLELPARAPAGLPLEPSLSADEPATFAWRYAEQTGEFVAQHGVLQLLVVPGPQALELSATDGAGNEGRYRYELYGVPELAPRLSAPERVLPGQPFSVALEWDASAEAEVGSLLLEVNGAARRVFAREAGAVALVGVPLGSPAGAWSIRATLLDGYGRSAVLERELLVVAEEQQVEELNLSPAVLSVSTPEARALEAQTMEAAYAQQDANAQPLWDEPFILPLEGRSTSGFGAARRYAPGGNVSYHYGADLAAPQGTPVRATNRGRVLVAGFYPIKGGFVVLDHGAGVYSLYLHQSQVLVTAGQSVARGEIIGEVGTTGLSSGPHLHWEMRVYGEATDPLAWVGRRVP